MSQAGTQEHGHESVLDPIIEDLCRPIKDLRKNFDVNISEYLAKYIDEIHSLVDINGEKMNFSQAAMMIQGSVGCYSKKVDYLHQYSMKTLNMIGKDGGDGPGDGDPADPEGGGGKRRRVGARMGEGDFVALDINIDKHTQKKDAETNLEVMAKKLGFIQITPREFIEKEGLDSGASKIELFYGSNYDLLGYKQDFKMNSQFSMATATFGDRLCLEPATDIERGLDQTIVNENYTESDQSFYGTEQPPLENNDGMNDNTVTNTSATDDDHDNGNNDYGNDDYAGDDGCHEEEELEIGAAGQHVAGRLRDCIASMQEEIQKEADYFQVEDPVEDPWQSEDIFEHNEDIKPIKRIKCYKLPACLKQKKGKTVQPVKEEGLPLISKFIVDAHERYLCKKYPWLSNEIFNEHLRQKQLYKLLKKNAQVPDDPVQVGGMLRGAADDHDGNDANDYDGGEDNYDAGDDAPAPSEDMDDEPDFEPLPAFECPDPHAGRIHQQPDSTLDDPEQDGSIEKTVRGESYEELVSKMVSEFVQRSQAWLASTDMARKVQSWHEMIRPRLQAVEKRAAFDIHEYGSQILGTFPSEDDTSSKITFCQVAQKKRKEEVSRYFLASLMLANCENIEIESKGEINDMTMRFLSTRRHHEDLHEFQAASQQI